MVRWVLTYLKANNDQLTLLPDWKPFNDGNEISWTLASMSKSATMLVGAGIAFFITWTHTRPVIENNWISHQTWTGLFQTPHASPGILAMNYKTPPCLIWILPNKLKNSALPHHLHVNWVFAIFYCKIQNKMAPYLVFN